jgi:protein arginine kinase activator
MSFPCQRCQQARATVHVTDTVPEKRERHLCEACAEKEGIIVKQQYPGTNEILQQFIKQKTGLSSADDLTCPKCGLTFREFQLKGQLGCPHDYVAFAPVLTPLIERAHDGATHHIGKVPPTADETIKRETGLLRLRRVLQEAIDQENYELAARVRDEIKTLEVESK